MRNPMGWLLDAVGRRAAGLILKANPALLSVPHQWTGSEGGYNPDNQDFEKFLTAVGLFSWVTSCVDAIANTGAALEWRLFRRDAEGGDEITQHPILDLLRNPNPEQGTHSFVYSALQNRGYHGNIYLTAATADERYEPVPWIRAEEWWVLPSARTKPRRAKGMMRDGKSAPSIIGYVIEDENHVAQRTFDLNQVVHIKRPNPTDPIVGLSPLAELRTCLQLMASAQKWNTEYFQHGAWPGLVFKRDQRPLDKEREAFEDLVNGRTSGVQNAGRNFFLWGQGADVTRLGNDPKEAAFLELLAWCREEILAVYKVPPFALALLEHANWSNAVEQQQFFYRNAVLPALREFLDGINSSPMVMAWGEDLYFDYDESEVEALQPNRAEAMDRAVAGYGAGLLTKDEARAEIGLEPAMEGGDEFKPAMDFGGLFGGGAEDGADADDARVELGILVSQGAFRKALEVSKRLRADGKAASARDQRWNAFRIRTEALERSVRTVVRKQSRDIRAAVLEEIARRTAELGDVKARGDQPVPPDWLDDLFLIEDFADAFTALLRPVLSRVYQEGAEDLALEATGDFVPFDLDRPEVAAFLENHTATRVVTVLRSRQAEVRGIVERSIRDAETVDQLSGRLREHFTGTPAWAHRIARTETIGLYNRGAIAGLEDAGVVSKVWLSARDEKVRDTHWEADGQEVGLLDNFVVGGHAGPAPGQIGVAEEDINCRCTVTAGSVA